MAEKKKSPLKIILIVVGILAAIGIATGVVVGINVANEVAKITEYRTTVDDINSIVSKYNEITNLESVALANSTDEAAVKQAAANDVAKIQGVISEVENNIAKLGDKKIFAGDDGEAKTLYETLQSKMGAFKDFYNIVIEAYTLKSNGDFTGAQQEMLSGDLTADSEFVTALNKLNQYLVKKANGTE